MNRPYVKRYDANGNLINPISGEFLSLYPNRRKRRSILKKLRKNYKYKG